MSLQLNKGIFALLLVFTVTASFRYNSNNGQPNVNKIGLPNKDSIIFRQNSFQDFSQGTLSNAGHNLYVSKNGQVQFVNWFDLDNNGYPEVVMVNDHDHYEMMDAFIYYNRQKKGFRSLFPPLHEYMPSYQKLNWVEQSLKSMDRLPTIGAGRSLITDLDKDGYPDIIFTNFIHGWSSNHYPVYIYWGDRAGYSRARMSALPTLSASGLASADLNGDGKPELVIANSGREYVVAAHSNKEYLVGEQLSASLAGPEEGTSYIYWQNDYGLSEKNRSEIATEYALDVKIGDLNNDSYPDLVFLQSGSRKGGGGSIRIYYGNAKGEYKVYKDIKALAPSYEPVSRKLLVADLNNDNRLDIFVPSEGGSSEIFWQDASGFSQSNVTLIEGNNVLGAEALDFNKDGFIDLAIANGNGNSVVYWGSKSGFSPSNNTILPTKSATGVAAADFNSDGYPDLVFSNRMEPLSFDIASYIYWGSADGFHAADRQDISSFGAVDVTVADLDADGNTDILLMNRQSGVPNNQVSATQSKSGDLFVYWGNPRYKFSEAAISFLPGVTAQADPISSDFNADGFADLAYPSGNGKTLNVFYGSKDGYDSKNGVKIEVPFVVRTVLAADLQRDGYLDIIIGSKLTNEFAVINGREGGFKPMELYDFGIPEYSATIGDIDGDGHLDLVFGSIGDIKILYSDAQGRFNKDKTTSLPVGKYTTKISLADFNNDGTLDIFCHHFSEALKLWENNINSNIYWNRNGKFSVSDQTGIPTHGAHSGTVADVNKDGYPDIVVANYNSQITRKLDTYIYWGDAKGNYAKERRTELPSHSASANQVLDLNGDGYNDVIVFNHSESNQYSGLQPMGGIHGTGSYIYWGSEKGWGIHDYTLIPSYGPHTRLNAEPGNIMRRSDFEEFTSGSISIKADKSINTIQLEVEGSFNFRQNIEVEIKTANTKAMLNEAKWATLQQVKRDDTQFSFTGTLNANAGAKFVQYRLRLFTGNSGTGPVIKAVTLKKNKPTT